MKFTGWVDSAEEAEALVVHNAENNDPVALSYIKSFHIMRTGAGLFGFILPIVLVGGVRVLEGDWNLRESLSAYYHTGMRDFFVGLLATVGIFLVAYKMANREVDSRLTSFAGIMAIGVAIFPTRVDDLDIPTPITTPIQDWLSQDTSGDIHNWCARLFIGSLIIMCVLFAKAELNPNLERFHSHRGKLGAKFWFWIHIAAALVMLAAAGYIGYTQHYNVNDDHSIFWGEVAVILAFGISWLAKGIDTKALWPGKLQSGNQDVVHGKTSASLNPNAQTPRHHGSH